MIVTRTSPISGKTYEMDLPITQDQVEAWNKGGNLIQDVFPNLTPPQREFILSGIIPQEWDLMFKEDEE